MTMSVVVLVAAGIGTAAVVVHVRVMTEAAAGWVGDLVAMDTLPGV